MKIFPVERIVLIGCGGIGGWLFEPLLRYLHINKIKVPVYIVDGDQVEERNLLRQNFMSVDIGLNKAVALACKYGFRNERGYLPCEKPFFNVDLHIIESFITHENLSELIVENTIVLLCVDNNWSRRVIEEYSIKLKNIVLISASNDNTDGDVLQYCSFKGKRLTPLLSEQNPDIGTATERPSNMGVLGCANARVQNHIANYTSSMLVLEILEKYLTLSKKEWIKIKGIRYDLKSFSTQYEYTKKDGKIK